jgi:hypothetical protein
LICHDILHIGLGGMIFQSVYDPACNCCEAMLDLSDGEIRNYC